MSKRSQHRDPADPMQWIGQPSPPHDPYAFLNPGRFHWAQKTYIFFGCLLMGTFALTWAALIAVGLIQTNGPAFWALLILIGAAITGTLAGVASVTTKTARTTRTRRHP